MFPIATLCYKDPVCDLRMLILFFRHSFFSHRFCTLKRVTRAGWAKVRLPSAADIQMFGVVLLLLPWHKDCIALTALRAATLKAGSVYNLTKRSLSTTTFIVCLRDIFCWFVACVFDPVTEWQKRLCCSLAICYCPHCVCWAWNSQRVLLRYSL